MIEPPPGIDRPEREAGSGVPLTYAFDDEADPRYVTLYPADHEALTTTWVTMDVEHAVDPHEMA